ncbi:MAG: chemotaxis response regulator protein-glutamate methylesterase [Chloroflexi bacterium]|nr:chemotaxis response regulator protein-glutamate methylesterase [Chloroflexota bacterium]
MVGASPGRQAVLHRPDAAPIRVLVVDDSVLIRQSVRRILDADPDIEVVDVARDGLEALLKIEKHRPAVVTLDVEMPNLDGLTTLRLLMERFPCPVVMLSSLTAEGAEATVRALAHGAVDFLQKPNGSSGGISSIAAELVGKVKHAAQARVRRPLPGTSPRPGAPPQPGAAQTRLTGALAGRPASSAPAPVSFADPGVEPDRLLVIGSSTGGPRALAEVVASLPADLPCATIIVQHLPAGFTKSLAERLDQGSPLAVAEARDGDHLAVGRVLLAPGDFHLKVIGRRVQLDSGPRLHGVRPSVDITLETAAATFGSAVLTAILTGMGEDGTPGARAVKAAGGLVLAEDESTCVVFGMPRAVVEAGLADEVVPLDQMAAAIGRHLRALHPRPIRRSLHAR